MDLFVYSDESGVFDYIHNDYYVFGGIVLLGKETKNVAERKYIAAEKSVSSSGKYEAGHELKASYISNNDKGKLYRSLNSYYKFAVIVKQKDVLTEIFDNKKSKQRYLDYAYKIGLKKLLKILLDNKLISSDNIETIHVFCDEHTTATDGKYELKEALLQEYKMGTFNMTWNSFYPPILPKLKGIDMKYCNSATTTMVRAADIIANKVYYCAINNKINELNHNNIIITFLP